MTTSSTFLSFAFWLEIDGITEAMFSECAGLQVETEMLSWEEGGLNSFVHMLPGRAKFSNLTIKRGVAAEGLWRWFSDCMCGTIQRRSLSIFLRDINHMGSGEPKQIRWDVVDALPIKWSGPDFRASSSDVAFETVELAHHGFKRT